jgi:hypothetical protein
MKINLAEVSIEDFNIEADLDLIADIHSKCFPKESANHNVSVKWIESNFFFKT